MSDSMRREDEDRRRRSDDSRDRHRGRSDRHNNDRRRDRSHDDDHRRRRRDDDRSRDRDRRDSDRDRRDRSRSRERGRRGGEEKKKVVEKEPRWGKKEEYEEEEKTTVQEVEKANFGLTGNLMADEDTGTVVNGVVLKWSEPPEARKPSTKWRLYVFKGEELHDKLHIHRQSSYLIGREKRVADIPAYHPSISSQHAVIQFRQIEKPGKMGKSKFVVRPYLMDLDSTNGTTLNKTKISSARYVELREKDLINFGHSTRDYVLIKERS